MSANNGLSGPFLKQKHFLDSIIIAYAQCIAHGIDMAKGADDQDFAVKSGYWPLFHYYPTKPRGRGL